MKFIKIIGFLTAFAIAETTNYCAKNCSLVIKHIACENKGRFAPNCPPNARLIDMTPHKAAIVESHNVKRNLIAQGKFSVYKPAARMATMQWDDELAFLATLNIKRCHLTHDTCHSTENFLYSGQNLAGTYYAGAEGYFKDAAIIADHINEWFKEYENCNMTYINKFPALHRGREIGHFTVMVAEKNTRVGCAAGRWKDIESKYNFFNFACNYATTNIINRPIYKSSTKAASDCRTGRHPTYRSLCSIEEKY